MAVIREVLDHFLEHRPLEEVVVLVITTGTALLLTLFLIGRVLTANWALAGIDMLVICITAATWLYIRRKGHAVMAGRVWIGLLLCVLVLLVSLFGPHMLFWVFPVVAATFFLFQPLAAAGLTTAVAAALAVPMTIVGGWAGVADFYGALFATILLAFTVAESMRHGRSALAALAERDALTGVGNRRGLMPSMSAALRRRARGTASTLLLIDFDNFKAVNDSCGHATGDRVLVELAALVSDTVRASDDVFRYGGDELIALTHGASTEVAAGIAEKIRERTAQSVPRGGLQVTVSIGIAEANANETPESWLARADAMLYRAKREGRNRIEVERDNGRDGDIG